MCIGLSKKKEFFTCSALSHIQENPKRQYKEAKQHPGPPGWHPELAYKKNSIIQINKV